MTGPTSHARLSASSAHRWLNCAGSIALSEGTVEAPSRYAAEGTFAHDIAADCLETDVDAVAFLGHKGKVDGFDFEVDQDMADAIQVYLDAVREAMSPKNGPTVAKFEVSLLAPLATVDPDLGGTADAVVYCPAEQLLKVFDFKFGAGTYVEADSNEQMMLYALGAMLANGSKPIKEVEVTIVQPRFEGAKPVRSWRFPAVDILDFAADIKEAATRTRIAGTPVNFLVSGDWCKFCKAARTCPELEKKHHALVAAEFDANLPVDYKALASALQSISLVKERIKAIEEFAYKEACAGREIPGFKLVDKRPSRQWSSEADVIEWAQKNAVDPYAPRELLSVAQLEKKLGETAARGKKKEAGKALEPFVVKVSSGTALVPATDDRPPARLISGQDFPVIEGAAEVAKNPLFS